MKEGQNWVNSFVDALERGKASALGRGFPAGDLSREGFAQGFAFSSLQQKYPDIYEEFVGWLDEGRNLADEREAA
jgi:hypothetical protein